MTKERKQELVEQLTERLRGAPSLYLTDFTGIAVKPMTDLRRRLRRVGSEYVVVKNTLALRALGKATLPGLDDELAGPTGFVFGATDPIAVAKVLADFQKENETLKVKAGLVDGRTMTGDEIRRLATLPSREQLLAQLAGALQAPLAGFVGALSGLLQQFVGAVEALRAERARN
jgi:large subunit ribosomal protein L10